jgi:FkbM family methyltransferase
VRGASFGPVNRISSATPFLERVKGFARELRCAAHFAPASRARYCADTVAYRVLRIVPSMASDRIRTLELRDGTKISYRRNRGDIQAIREIWFMPTYLPPFPSDGLDVVVDVGANIGFTTVYFARRHGARTCIAVEPDADNARVLRRNLEQNGIRAIVLQAAVGHRDGTAYFARAEESTLGRLADDGLPVRVLSMPTVLAELGGRRVDLLKVDIEGGEGELFSGDTAWLDDVDALMMEFHPTAAEPAPIIASLETRGFRHIPVDSVRHGTTDAFVRSTARA